MKSEEILIAAAKALDNKKAENLSAVRVEDLTSLAEDLKIWK